MFSFTWLFVTRQETQGENVSEYQNTIFSGEQFKNLSYIQMHFLMIDDFSSSFQDYFVEI